MTDGGNTFPEWGNWREYQEAVATCFRRLGYAVEVDATVEGVRGTHSVDVRVAFSQHGLACQWIVECKLWKRRVTKEKVLALQAIVADVGADRGVLFSEGGFQTGAQRVAQGSNVTLVPSLKEFIATASANDPPKEDRLLEIPQIDGGPTLFRFPGPPARPQHLVRHGNSLIVGNWNTGNITFVDPRSRSIEGVIDLDRYETTRNRERVREIRTHPPGQLAVADGKLFLGRCSPSRSWSSTLQPNRLSGESSFQGAATERSPLRRTGGPSTLPATRTMRSSCSIAPLMSYTAIPIPLAAEERCQSPALPTVPVSSLAYRGAIDLRRSMYRARAASSQPFCSTVAASCILFPCRSSPRAGPIAALLRTSSPSPPAADSMLECSKAVQESTF